MAVVHNMRFWLLDADAATFRLGRCANLRAVPGHYVSSCKGANQPRVGDEHCRIHRDSRMYVRIYTHCRTSGICSFRELAHVYAAERRCGFRNADDTYALALPFRDSVRRVGSCSGQGTRVEGGEIAASTKIDDCQ